MNEYINRENTIINFGFQFEDIPPTPEEFANFMRSQKSADVRPVVYGHWKKGLFYISFGSDDEIPIMVCSVCGHAYPSSWGVPYNFCPGCGADMRGDAV